MKVECLQRAVMDISKRMKTWPTWMAISAIMRTSTVFRFFSSLLFCPLSYRHPVDIVAPCWCFIWKDTVINNNMVLKKTINIGKDVKLLPYQIFDKQRWWRGSGVRLDQEGSMGYFLSYHKKFDETGTTCGIVLSPVWLLSLLHTYSFHFSIKLISIITTLFGALVRKRHQYPKIVYYTFEWYFSLFILSRLFQVVSLSRQRLLPLTNFQFYTLFLNSL